MKTSIYIDGYNLYYGRLRNTQFKWLDVVALFSNMAITIEPKSAVNAVKYFTAPALTKFARHGAESMKAQNDYHRALEAKYPSVFSKILGSHRKLPCQVDNLKLEISLTNFLGMNSIGATSPRDSCGLNSL